MNEETSYKNIYSYKFSCLLKKELNILIFLKYYTYFSFNIYVIED